MKEQHIRMTKELHDLWFKFNPYSLEYKIARPDLDNMLGLFGEELDHMKRFDKENANG